MERRNKKFAFTLAEVLITLAVIGVVASMTLPTLIQKQNDKATVSRLKKSYSALSQAFYMIQKDYGEPTGWLQTEDANEIGNLFVKYMKVLKNCGTNEGCFSDTNNLLHNTSAGDRTLNTRSDMSKFILSDGQSIALKMHAPNCDKERGTNKQLGAVCGWVVVDTNGIKKPNTYGIDIFEFNITKYGIYPYGTEFDTEFPFEGKCKNQGKLIDGNGCTAWVLYNENLDYLHCPSELSWNGKKACK